MTRTANTSRAAAALGRKGGKAKSAAKAAAARANGAKGGRPRVTPWTVREVTERGAVEFSVSAGDGADGAEIIATLLPDNPEDEAVFAVHATWGEIGPREGVDADLDTLAWRVSAALPRVGGWGYDSAAGAIVQCGKTMDCEENQTR